MKKITKLLLDGIIFQNPVLVLLLGMCSALAITTTLANGVGMGLAVILVLTGSNMVISLIRRVIPSKIRIAVFVVVISTFTTIVDLVMQAYLPALSDSLGIFIPLIVVNCIILARAEAFASKNSLFYAAVDGIAMGVGFTLALCVVSIVREILGSGTLLGMPLFGENFQPIMMLVFPAGGFLTLGCVIAAMQKLLSLRKEKSK